MELTASRTSLFVVVYRPPKYNKTFIHEFADRLGSVIFKYDCVLIVGDFNIHICCNDDPLAKDFCRTDLVGVAVTLLFLLLPTTCSVLLLIGPCVQSTTKHGLVCTAPPGGLN